MKKLTFSLFVYLLLTNYTFAQPDNWAKYNSEKKDEFIAGALEFLVPIVGHAYAGDASRGVLPTLVSVGGLGLYIIGVSSAISGDLSNVSSGFSTASLGLLIYFGGRVWGIVSAVQTAQDHNNALKRKLNLSIVPYQNPNGDISFGINLKYNF